MPKQPVSLTIEQENLLWLRGRSTALGHGSLSETVDRLVSEARAGRLGTPAPPRSVVGTIDIAADDPDLEQADAVLRDLFGSSLARPLLVGESSSGYAPAPTTPPAKKARRAVADVAAAVADTHALLFHATGHRHLGRAAAAHFARSEARQAITYVPVAVLWEVSLLARASRVNLRRTVRAFFDDLCSNPAFQPVDLTPEHVHLADELRFTRDPFDALIVAAARIIDRPLMTRDTAIRDSGAVRILW